MTDGSELASYNALIEQLSDIKNFQSLGSVQPGSANDNFNDLSRLSDTYINAVKEIGFPNLPAYSSNSLGYKDIKDFRTRTTAALMNHELEPNNETCGASMVFLYPTLVASTLQDIKPQYIEPQATPARVTALRQAAQQDLRNDRNLLQSMCNTVQLQPAIQGLDNLLSLVRSDSASFLMSIERVNGKNIPANLAAQPKQPMIEHLPVAPQRPRVGAKADQYANCAAVVGALREFSTAKGVKYDEAGSSEMETSFIIASIIYSDADKAMRLYQTLLYSNSVQMQQHPEQMKYWVNQTFQRCTADFNNDRSHLNTYAQEGRNEFAEKFQALLKSAQNSR
ncbi:hypothetical protein [Pseudomonas sp. NUPR-001]|uniref:hypothetical protein n=1 Tax=Pseudomonas sp. NUPR-001 TaxID=3416058 RepID=UPI003F9AC781